MQKDDVIYRQDAIDAMNEVYCHIEMIKKRPVNKIEQAMYLDMIGAVKSVPSAEPEIIQCKDCKYWNIGDCNCPDIRVDCSDYYVGDIVTEEDFYCGFAKRGYT